jgi:predicted small integral membrane protein
VLDRTVFLILAGVAACASFGARRAGLRRAETAELDVLVLSLLMVAYFAP